MDREVKAAQRSADPARARQIGRTQNNMYLYGMTPELWAWWFERQQGCCRYCREPLDVDRPHAVHIDHAHWHCRGKKSCGACIRGLVCSMCNAGIGHFADNPDLMERVAAQLRAADAEIRAEIEAKPVQEELPLNVSPIRREVAN